VRHTSLTTFRKTGAKETLWLSAHHFQAQKRSEFPRLLTWDIHLTVASLDRQITFYTQVLGLKVHWREGSEAALGTDAEVLLRLTEDPAARRVQHASGMYHFAILYPS
jgi:hypothetical protein